MEIEMRNTHRRERDRKSSKSCFISQSCFISVCNYCQLPIKEMYGKTRHRNVTMESERILMDLMSKK